jgi:hypothetical protein
MFAKLMTVAAVSITIAACSAHAAEADGYLYPNFWGAPAASVSSSAPSNNQSVMSAPRAPADTSIFSTHVEPAKSPGVWLFPPNQLGGGNN